MSAVVGRHARPRSPFRHRTAALAAATSLGGLTAALLRGGTAAQAATATTTPKTLVSSYTVVSGDTLSGIAVKEHVPGGWSALAKSNKISSPYVIRTGEKLALPKGSYVLTPVKAPTASFPVAVTVGSATEVITVKASGSYATVIAWQKSGSIWKIAYSTKSARIGAKGITNGATRVQNTNTTPTGTYTITQGFGVGANPGTAMPYHQVTSHDWWVEDPTSSYYNQMRTDTKGGFHLTESGADGSEHLIEYPTQYHNALVINFNMNPAVKGRGAGIFLHDLGPQAGATGGCVALPATVMTQIIKWIKPTAHPVIAIG